MAERCQLNVDAVSSFQMQYTSAQDSVRDFLQIQVAMGRL